MPSKYILTDKHILQNVTSSIVGREAYIVAAVGLVLLTAGCSQTMSPDLGTTVSTQPQTEITLTPTSEPPTALPVTATIPSELTAIPTTIDIPSWLIDPDADVVMTKTVKYNEQISKAEYGVTLFNASSGERFDLPLKGISAYFWMPDGKQIGLLLSSDESSLYLVDGATGRITRSELIESVIKHAIYGSEPTPLVPSGADITTPDFFLFNPSGRYYFRYEISADRRYRVTLEYLENDKTITLVEDLQTGQQVQVPQSEGLFDRLPAWSPVGHLLAVVQGTEPWSLDAPPGERVLRIYDASTGEFLASYPGDFGGIVWSPDGACILYGAEQPCILEWEKEHSWCLGDGRSFHGGEQVVDYDWSPDGDLISYIYFSYPSFGGLCIKSLTSGDIRCPTMDIPELAERYIRRYGWSPEGQYLIFVSDSDSCPDCDYSNDPQIGIVNVVTGTYWYPLENFDYDTPDLALWRPEIPSQ